MQDSLVTGHGDVHSGDPEQEEKAYVRMGQHTDGDENKKMMENKEEMAHDYTGELMSEAGYVRLFQGES